MDMEAFDPACLVSGPTVCAVVGGRGAGKTTLLAHLCGLMAGTLCRAVAVAPSASSRAVLSTFMPEADIHADWDDAVAGAVAAQRRASGTLVLILDNAKYGTLAAAHDALVHSRNWRITVLVSVHSTFEMSDLLQERADAVFLLAEDSVLRRNACRATFFPTVPKDMFDAALEACTEAHACAVVRAGSAAMHRYVVPPLEQQPPFRIGAPGWWAWLRQWLPGGACAS